MRNTLMLANLMALVAASAGVLAAEAPVDSTSMTHERDRR
jgi:hypothetical protein